MSRGCERWITKASTWARGMVTSAIVGQKEKDKKNEEEAFRVASEDGCQLVRDDQLHKEILGLFHQWIEGLDLSEEDNGCTTWATFPATGWRIPPKNEEQTSWRLDDAPWEPAPAWVPNYIWVGDHKEFEGLMDKMTLGEFKARFGEDRAPLWP
eukprot:s5371_g4.t1